MIRKRIQSDNVQLRQLKDLQASRLSRHKSQKSHNIWLSMLGVAFREQLRIGNRVAEIIEAVERPYDSFFVLFWD